MQKTDSKIYIRMDGGGFMPWFTFTLVVNDQEFKLGYLLDDCNVRKEIHQKAMLILTENDIHVDSLDFMYGRIYL